MKALVMTAYGRLEYLDVAAPEIGPGDVLVRVKACGICGSDVHGLGGSTGRRLPPVIMGHEASGLIAATGSEVRGLLAGARVAFDPNIFCGACYFCRRGKPNICDQRRYLGVSCAEFRMDGAFAEYVALPQRVIYPIPDAVSFEQAALLEPLSVVVHAVGRLAPQLGDRALVIGAGAIGLFTVQVLRLAGCERIMVTDLDPGRLELARQLGADETIAADPPGVVEAVLRQTDGRGADVVVDAVGTATTVGLAVECARRAGSVGLTGNLSPAAELPLQRVVMRELTVRGSCYSSSEYPASLALLAQGRIDVNRLISAVVPLSEAGAWFAKLKGGRSGLLKVVVTP